MPSTPTTKYGFVTEADADALVGAPARLRTLVTAIDGAIAGYATGTQAARPAASVAGRIYRATDLTGEVALDNGTTWQSLGVARVSSLPTANLYDGQTVDYVADATNGVLWRLRYNAGGGTYKWECVGGGPLSDEVLTSQSTSSTTYTDLTTVGPTITVPLAGDYAIILSSTIDYSSSPGGLASVKFGAAAASDNDAIVNNASVGTLVDMSASRTIRRNVSAGGTVVKMVYKSVTGSAVNWLRRDLIISPIRVA